MNTSTARHPLIPERGPIEALRGTFGRAGSANPPAGRQAHERAANQAARSCDPGCAQQPPQPQSHPRPEQVGPQMQGNGQAQVSAASPQQPTAGQAGAVMWQMHELRRFFSTVFMARWCVSCVLLFHDAKVTAGPAMGITS